VPMAAGWLVWAGGQGAEPPALAGAAAAAAALLTRGNARFSGDAISRTVDGLAASLDGFAGRNSVGLHWECLARDLPQVLDLALECGHTPQFLARELAEERRVALQELAAEADDLGQLAIRAMAALLHGDHPLRRPLRGTPAGLRALTQERLAGLWRGDYPLGRAVLGVVGDIDLDAVLAKLTQVDAELSRRTGRKGPAPKARTTPVGRGPRERVVLKDREQAHIAVGFPGLVLGDPREPVLDVLSAILGGQSGRLFTALREVQGLVYDVSVSAVSARDAGHVVVHASTSQDKLPRARAAIAEELAKAIAGPPTAEELARAQAWLIGQHEIGQQRRSRVASQIAFSAAYGHDHARHFTYPARVAAIAGAEVWALAKHLLDPARQVVGLVRAP
jgi:zinc protease